MKYIFSIFLWTGIAFTGWAMDDADERVSRDEQENMPAPEKARKTRRPTIEAIEENMETLKALMGKIYNSETKELLTPLAPEAPTELENQVKVLVAQMVELLQIYYQEQLAFLEEKVRFIETDLDQINLYNTFCKKHLQNNVFFDWCCFLAVAHGLPEGFQAFFDKAIREAFGIFAALPAITPSPFSTQLQSYWGCSLPTQRLRIPEWVQLYWKLVGMDPEEGEDWCHSMHEHIQDLSEKFDRRRSLGPIAFAFRPREITYFITEAMFRLTCTCLCLGNYPLYMNDLWSMNIHNGNDQYLTMVYIYTYNKEDIRTRKELGKILKKAILEGTAQQMKQFFLYQNFIDLGDIRDLINEPSEMHPLQIAINQEKYDKVKLLLEWGADYTHESINVGALWEILFGAHSAITLPEALAAEIRAHLEDRRNLPVIEEVPLPMPTPSPTPTPNPFDRFGGGGAIRAAFFGKGLFY